MNPHATSGILEESATRRGCACAAAASRLVAQVWHYFGTTLPARAASRSAGRWCAGWLLASASPRLALATLPAPRPGPARRLRAPGHPPGGLREKGTHQEREVTGEALTFSRPR